MLVDDVVVVDRTRTAGGYYFIVKRRTEPSKANMHVCAHGNYDGSPAELEVPAMANREVTSRTITA